MKKMFFFFAALFIAGAAHSQEKSIAEKLVQEQLDAYNKRDIDAFLMPYSDTVAVYMFPNQFLYKGKETMRKEYADMFKNTPLLNCAIVKRIVLGNRVIDEESVTYSSSKPPFRAAAVYTISGDKIVEVRFIQ